MDLETGEAGDDVGEGNRTGVFASEDPGMVPTQAVDLVEDADRDISTVGPSKPSVVPGQSDQGRVPGGGVDRGHHDCVGAEPAPARPGVATEDHDVQAVLGKGEGGLFGKVLGRRDGGGRGPRDRRWCRRGEDRGGGSSSGGRSGGGGGRCGSGQLRRCLEHIEQSRPHLGAHPGDGGVGDQHQHCQRDGRQPVPATRVYQACSVESRVAATSPLSTRTIRSTSGSARRAVSSIGPHATIPHPAIPTVRIVAATRAQPRRRNLVPSCPHPGRIRERRPAPRGVRAGATCQHRTTLSGSSAQR